MNSILIKNELCQTLYIIKKEGEHKSIHFFISVIKIYEYLKIEKLRR